LVEFDENRDLAWTSITGIDQRGRWRLREAPGGGTVVTLRLAYHAPGGILATIADRLSAPMVGRHLEQSLENVRRELEGGGSVSEEGVGLPGRIGYNLGSAGILMERGVIRPMRPDRLVRVLSTLARWGRSPAAGYIAMAQQYPDEPSVVDELGTLTFREMDVRSNRLAHSLSDAG